MFTQIKAKQVKFLTVLFLPFSTEDVHFLKVVLLVILIFVDYSLLYSFSLQLNFQVVELAFHMDDVPTVQNLTGTPKLDNRLKYYPNPRVHNFTENGGVKVLKGDSLIIEVSQFR